MRASTVFVILLLAVLAFGFVPSQVHAAAPRNLQISANNSSGITYGTNLNFNDNVFADKVQSLSNEINFTNVAYSASSNPTQNFGVAQCCSSTGISNALNDIQSDHVEFKLSFTSGNPMLYFYYIMPSGLSYTYPQNVLVTYGTLTQTISYPYYSDGIGFNACTAPCAYLNQANKTMIVKSVSNSPNTIDIYYSPAPTNGGPPSGCVVNCGGVTTTATTTASNVAPSGGGGGIPQLCIPFVTCPTTTTTTTTTTTNTNLPSSPSIGNLSDLTYSFGGVIAIVMLIAGYQFIKNHLEPNLGRSGGSGGGPHRHAGGGGGPSRSGSSGSHPTRSKGSNPHPGRSGESILDRFRRSRLKRRGGL